MVKRHPRRWLLLAALFGSECGVAHTQQASNIRDCTVGDAMCLLQNPRGWVIDMTKLMELRKELRLQWVLGSERDHHVLFRDDGTWTMTWFDDTPQHSSYREMEGRSLEETHIYLYDINNNTLTGWNLLKNMGTEILVVDKLTPYSLAVHEINDPDRVYHFKVRAITSRELVK